MQLLELTILKTGTRILLNRGGIQSVREISIGTFVRHISDKLAYIVSETIDYIIEPVEYVSGIIIPLVIQNPSGTTEAVSLNVDSISKVVEGSVEGTCYVFHSNRVTRFLALHTIDEILAMANAVVGDGGSPVPGDASGIRSAHLVNVGVTVGPNVITHNMDSTVLSVFVKLGDSWFPWAWDDINSNSITLTFDEVATVQVRILANAVDGGSPIPGDASGIRSAHLVNVGVVVGPNVITHNMGGTVLSVFVKLGDSWFPWAWDDVNSNSIALAFDEVTTVQVRILLTII